MILYVLKQLLKSYILRAFVCTGNCCHYDCNSIMQNTFQEIAF